MLQMKKKNRLSAAFIFIFLAVVCLFAYSPSADAKPSSHRLELEQTFRKSHGTLVLKNLKTDQVYTFNSGRSKQRFTPNPALKWQMPSSVWKSRLLLTNTKSKDGTVS